MSVEANKCKDCGAQMTKVEWRLEAVQYPYNPEWPQTMMDAGVFCSPACLSHYTAER